MAVRLDTAGESLLRTANVPAQTACTICGWAVMVTDRNIETALCSLESGTTSAASYVILATNADGTALKVWNTTGEGTTFATITVGVPFFFALTTAGNTAASQIGYFRAYGSNTLSSGNPPGTGSTFTPAALYVGIDSFGEWFNGRVWNVKVWDRVLSSEELLIESFYDRPQFPASLNVWWQLPNASDTADRSGNARAPTVGGTLSTEDSVVNLWKPSPKFIVPANTAPPVTQNAIAWITA